jgi:hypothetical protein
MTTIQQKLRTSIKEACALSLCNCTNKTEHVTDIGEEIEILSEQEKVLKNELNAIQMKKFELIIQHTGQDAYDLASRE